MASQYDIKSFIDLQSLTKSELCQVPADTVAEISLKALETCNNVQVFKFWTKEILITHNLNDFNEEFLQKILSAFVNYTVQTIPDSALKCVTEQCFNSIIFNLEDWQNIISKVDSNLRNVTVALIIVTSALQVLSGYYSFLKNSNGVTVPLEPFCKTGLTALMANSQHLQRSILSVILDNPTYFICRYDTDIPSISNVFSVMECLIAVGKIVPGLDVRLTAEIWKVIAKIFSENVEFVKISEIGQKLLLIGRPVKFLCEEIRKSLHDIYEVSSMNLEIVERILKISSFYMKLVIRFASENSHEYFVDCDEVLATVVMLLSPPERLKSSEVGTLIKQYLTIGFINLIGLIYKNIEFAKFLCNESIGSNRHFEAIFNLSSEVLKLLINENDSTAIRLYFSNDLNFIENLFNGVSKYPSILLVKVNYESFVTTVTTLIISVCNVPDLVAYFEKYLIRGISQNILMLANVCMDIWLTLARFIDGESRYKYFSFWFKRCSKFSPLSNEPQLIYAKNLCKNLYNILPSSYKHRFWQEVMPINNNMTALLIFGCDKILDNNTREEIERQLINELKSVCSNFSSKITIEEYYALVQNLQILSISSTSCEYNVYEQIIKLFMKLLKITKKHTILHISLIMFITKHIRNFLKTDLIDSIRLLIQSMVFFNGTTFKLWVLILTSKINKIEQQSELLQLLLKSLQTDSNVLITSTAQVLFDDYKDSPSRIWSDSEIINFLNEPSEVKYIHNCKNDEFNRDGNPAKKLKTNVTQDVLRKILYDVNKFADIQIDGELSSTDLALINEIKSVLIKISNK